MSVVLTLTSAAIIAGVSLATTTSLAILDQVSDGVFDASEGIDTMFVDCDILTKTLEEYDCHYDVISENEIIVKTSCGNLRYLRGNTGQAFKMYLDEIDDVEGLIANIKSFEVDYGRNVQAYTYNHIKENISSNMRIVDEEVLDDDSLMLKINIE